MEVSMKAKIAKEILTMLIEAAHRASEYHKHEVELQYRRDFPIRMKWVFDGKRNKVLHLTLDGQTFEVRVKKNRR